jgi:hypothetical protein
MELCPLGSLSSQFKRELLGRKLKIAIALDIALGMKVFSFSPPLF